MNEVVAWRVPVLTAAIVLLVGCDGGGTPPAAAPSAADIKIAALRDACRAERQELIERAQYAMEKEPSSVLRDLEKCWNALGDADLGALRKKAMARMHLLIALDKTNSAIARSESLSKVDLFDPEEYKRYAPLVASLRKAADAERAKEARAAAAAKRREGVLIGMSKADVLASSWGKPRKINSTHTASGTREQWVYDGGYLYFMNGVHTTIQN